MNEVISFLFLLLMGWAIISYSQNTYSFYYPLPQDYRISILVDPCRGLAYNCCVNAFGVAEYPRSRVGLEPERVVQVDVLSSDTEVDINYDLVYEDGSLIATTAKRAADDSVVINSSCNGLRNPFMYCAGKNVAYQRSPFRPPCSDNNYSVNSLLPCYDIYGNLNRQCVQVAYSQNAFIAQCSPVTSGTSCGTFLEIHQRHGSPFSAEADIISDVQVDRFNVTGAYTTTIPLIWMGNASRALCAYTELKLRVGSVVYILPSAPQCCCPRQYSFTSGSKFGAFWCPFGPSGGGPFATFDTSVTESITVDSQNTVYPFCLSGRSEPDQLVCSLLDSSQNRYFTRPCFPVNATVVNGTVSGYTSSDLQGQYKPPAQVTSGICPYTVACARTIDMIIDYTVGAVNISAACALQDWVVSFVGQVGVVTSLDNGAQPPQAWVSFNNGRTSYQFAQSDLQLNQPQRSNYEIWWVVRTFSGNIVSKRHGFNVTEPQCTFSESLNEYFPYAELDAMGNPIPAVP